MLLHASRRCVRLSRVPGRVRLPRGRQRLLSTAADDAATAVASGGFSPLSLSQEWIAHIHATTALPWWVTIAGSAIALRVAILPAVYYQVRETRLLLALRPQLLALRQETEAIASPNARAWERLSRMYALCRSRGVQPLRVIALPLAQIPFLLTLVFAVRRMLQPDSPWASSLAQGGASWFVDLTLPDPTTALPAISLLVLLGNFQLASSGGRSGLLYGLRNVLQAGSVVALPFYAELPAGVFMYWIPNSCFSLVQTVVVRRLMPMPGMPLAPGAAAAMPSSVPRAQGKSLAAEPASAQVAQMDGGGVLGEAAADAAAGEAAGAAASAMSEDEVEWRRRIAADAMDIEAHVLLSKLMLREKRPADAVDHLWPAVQAAPREASAPLRFQLGLAVALQEQHDVAQPLFRQVLELEPDFVEAWLCLASTLEQSGDAPGASEALEKAAELRPELREFVDREKARVTAAAADT